MTTPEQWPRIKEIVGAALEYPPSGRTSFLDTACSDDEQLRAEVDSLIAAYEQSEDFSSPGWQASFSGATEIPQTIGPYQLVRELGVGGMGQVWLAEQTEPVRRLVAIKLIRTDLYHQEILTRFLAERQSLALMNHPSIAKVFDAGTTASGQPYFVMEYVDGSPITEYCDRNCLTVAERLQLLQLVCEGVQHAHLKAIIHRDLKPSNILVTEVDGKATPRIIDFGVAKAISQDVDYERTQTRVGSIIGTFGYMSPEQAGSGSEDIDTRTDGYSLGVILYELLSGLLPFQQKQLTWYEAVRQLREQEAPRPSVRLRDAIGVAVIAHNRNAKPEALIRYLRGDLDSIVLKAIEIDRNRRYETPSALAADIDRFLRDEPVIAHSASAAYLARKYLRRHRAGAVVATTAGLLLIGFAIAQTWQLQNTRRQRDRADRITDFMTNMFKVADPSESRGSSITARQILDQSSHQVETGRGLDTTVQQQLMQVMAKTYVGLGIYGRAQDLAQQAYDNRRRSLGPNNPRTLESMAQVAEILERQGKVTEAQGMLQEAIEKETRALGVDDAVTLKSRQDLAEILRSRAQYIAAEKLERQIIPIETRTLGPAHVQTFASLNTLALAVERQSRFDEAEKIFRKLLDDERRALGPDHPYVLVTMHDMAIMFTEQGRNRDAEALYRETIEIERRVLGPEHPETADTLTTLAIVIRNDHHRVAEADALYRQALEIEQRVVGPDHMFTTRAMEGLANDLNSEGRMAEAQQLLQQVLATRQRTLGPNHTDTLLTGYNLADLLLKEKHYAEAEQLIRTTLAGQTRVLDANDPDTLASGTLLARVLLKVGRPQEAETFVRQAYTAQVRLLGLVHADTEDSRRILAKALSQAGRYDEAQTLFQADIAKMKAAGGAGAADVWYDFAENAALARHPNDAFTYLRNAIQTGFNDADFLRTDLECVSLRKDPRFAQIVAAMQRQAALPAHK
jgi:eukaryotic-like serine/threonine-protein kinase